MNGQIFWIDAQNWIFDFLHRLWFQWMGNRWGTIIIYRIHVLLQRFHWITINYFRSISTSQFIVSTLQFWLSWFLCFGICWDNVIFCILIYCLLGYLRGYVFYERCCRCFWFFISLFFVILFVYFLIFTGLILMFIAQLETLFLREQVQHLTCFQSLARCHHVFLLL